MEIYVGTYDGMLYILHATTQLIKPFINFKLS